MMVCRWTRTPSGEDVWRMVWHVQLEICLEWLGLSAMHFEKSWFCYVVYIFLFSRTVNAHSHNHWTMTALSTTVTWEIFELRNCRRFLQSGCMNDCYNGTWYVFHGLFWSDSYPLFNIIHFKWYEVFWFSYYRIFLYWTRDWK